MDSLAKQILRETFHKAGLDVQWYRPNPPHVLATLLELYKVDTIFDIGANNGVSGEYFRNIGFRGRIVSFEPVNRLFDQLQQKANKDPLWFCEKAAIGDATGELEINVSGDGGSASSFLEMAETLKQNAPELGYTGREMVKVQTIDSVIDHYYPDGDRLFLKLDIQGYEKRALEGAINSLRRIVGIRIEMSIVKNYEDELLIFDLLPYVYELGFKLTGIEPAWSNQNTQEIYQVDAVLFRTEKL